MNVRLLKLLHHSGIYYFAFNYYNFRNREKEKFISLAQKQIAALASSTRRSNIVVIDLPILIIRDVCTSVYEDELKSTWGRTDTFSKIPTKFITAAEKLRSFLIKAVDKKSLNVSYIYSISDRRSDMFLFNN